MGKTRSLLSLSVAALALSAVTAAAADLPFKAPMMAPVQVFDWSGWYAGIGLGGSWSNSNWTNPNGPGQFNVSFDQALAAVHGGAQYQFGGFGNVGLVMGYEYSGNFALDGYGDGGLCNGNPNRICRAKIESLYTIGGKLGLAWDRFMLYGTGGWAGGNVTSRSNNLVLAIVDSQTKQWQNGWYVGGGVDYAFFHTAGTDWIVGVDYKHIELDTTFHGVSNAPGNLDRNISADSDQLLGRLTVKFQGPLWPFTSATLVSARY